MQFTDAHSAASGLHAHPLWRAHSAAIRLGSHSSAVLTTFSPPFIEPERLTVASLLKLHGYHTLVSQMASWNGVAR